MRRFTDAGRRAIANGNLYAALSLALIVPDICGSLENPGPGKTRLRYVCWYQRWAEPKFTSPGDPPLTFISAEDCYQLRCSLIHSGSAEIDPKKSDILERFVFFDESVGAHLNWFEGIAVNGVEQPNFLQLKASTFSEAMFVATDEWDAAVASDAAIQAEKQRLLVIHSQGEVIGGIGFG